MDDGDARAIAKLHALTRKGERTRDHRLGCYDRGHRCQRDERIQKRPRRQKIKWVGRGLGVVQDESTLAEVVENETGKDESEPGESDRSLPEMAHVCIERFGASDRQHNGAKHHERCHHGGEELRESTEGRAQDSCYEDFNGHSRRDNEQTSVIVRKIRPTCGAFFLEDEEREDDGPARDHEFAQEGLNDSEAFGGAETGDRGSDHSVDKRSADR